jgi:hypothetical protein
LERAELKVDDSQTTPHRSGRTRLTLPLAAFIAALAIFGWIAPGRAQALTPAPTVSWVRVGYFATNPTAVDVYVDGRLTTANVAFQQVTRYLQLAPGAHQVAMRPASSPASAPPAASVTASLIGAGAATIVVVNGTSGLTAAVYQDDLSAPPPKEAKVRVVDAASGVSALDVFVAPAAGGGPASNVNTRFAGPPAFAGVTSGSASPYTALPAGSYDIEFRAPGSTQVVLSANNWPVEAGTIATVVVYTGPQGVTLEVLRDAAGVTAVPQGAMATGGGGMAHRGEGGLPTVVWSAPIVFALAAVGWGISRRRRRSGLAVEVVANTGSPGNPV